MADYKLYCFAQSGNAYRPALMLNLIGASWEPVFVDFFKSGETKTAKYRAEVNEMGEAPVLIDGDRKLSQSGVILQYLAKKSGKFLPKGEEEELEALRWIIFDNQKVNGFLGPYRFLKNWAPSADPAILAFFKGRLDNNLAIVNKRLEGRKFLLGERPRSPTFRCARICITHPRNSVSTSQRTTRPSGPGSSASRPCRTGRIPTT